MLDGKDEERLRESVNEAKSVNYGKLIELLRMKYLISEWAAKNIVIDVMEWYDNKWDNNETVS